MANNYPSGLAGVQSVTSTGNLFPGMSRDICACGEPATKWFSNPRGVSVPIEKGVLCLNLCDACEFRWMVMRAAGRVEEFIAEYEEKQAARRQKEQEVQLAYQKAAQDYYDRMPQVPTQQNYQSSYKFVNSKEQDV